MISTDPSIKNLIKEVLTEDYTRENNKVFSMSRKTFDNYNLSYNYLFGFRTKNKTNIQSILSDEIILNISNNQITGKTNVVDELISIIDNFNPNHYPPEDISSSVQIIIPLGGSSPTILDASSSSCCSEMDADEENRSCFIIPWDYKFDCNIRIKFGRLDNLLNLKHVLKFNDFGEIENISVYKM